MSTHTFVTDDPTPVAEQLQRALKKFEEHFGRPARLAALAPGRVNLIGEHTDYNDGFVLPMAICRQTIIVADRRPDRKTRVVSTGINHDASQREARFDVDPSLARGEPAWSNYVRGVVAGSLRREVDPGGFDALIDSTVPVGGGLSSSAALEVSTATLVEALAGKRYDPVEKALLCQWAEHNYALVPCGIMDQFISVMGKAEHAMLLDCRSHEVKWVPLTDPAVTVLIINSNVQHELTGGEYAQRRQQCEEAARVLGVKALRDATGQQVATQPAGLDEVSWRRARHVVTEIARTLKASDAAMAAAWDDFGQLMYQSHASLRDDFEVSTQELDLLVELTRPWQQAGKVFGSRMTGGGFGGCTVTLLRTRDVDEVTQDIVAKYHKQTGIRATAFATRAAAGARRLEL